MGLIVTLRAGIATQFVRWITNQQIEFSYATRKVTEAEAEHKAEALKLKIKLKRKLGIKCKTEIQTQKRAKIGILVWNRITKSGKKFS